EAGDGRQAVDLAHRLRPDLVLMDLLMPGLDGISATAAIRRELPAVEVLALTGYLEDHLIAAALHAGAVGYLLKDTDHEELQRAVRAAGGRPGPRSPPGAPPPIPHLPLLGTAPPPNPP